MTMETPMTDIHILESSGSGDNFLPELHCVAPESTWAAGKLSIEMSQMSIWGINSCLIVVEWDFMLI